MNRREQLRVLCTVEGRRAAALRRDQRRGGTDHRFVVGSFVLGQDGRVCLAAVMTGPAYDVPRPPVLTREAARFCRWRTRQAATQFRDRWGLADCHVFDLDWMDVRPGALISEQLADWPARACRENNSAGLSSRQRAGELT